MTRLEELISQAENIVIVGHTNPDGDCIGACLAVYNYIREQYAAKKVTVRLEPVPAKFAYLSGCDRICSVPSGRSRADLCICLDSADKERLGKFAVCLEKAAYSICIDHHVTNPGYARENIIAPHASSACEVLYECLDESRISKKTAECLYTGIIHDSGVFKYNSTTARTMEIAGKLMEKGIDFGAIIDDSFYRKTYRQSQIMGRALLESITFLDGKCVFSVIRRKDMEMYGVDKSDLDGIVEQLRLIDGVECAIFLYEVGNLTYKVSLRSKYIVDVSKVAAFFGGGGHVRAAGCTMTGDFHDVINNLSAHIEKLLDGNPEDEENPHD